MKDFEKAQHDRLSAELESAAATDAELEAAVEEALAAAEIGFVSQHELPRISQPLPELPVAAAPLPPRAA
jgi:hypothetical protein